MVRRKKPSRRNQANVNFAIALRSHEHYYKKNDSKEILNEQLNQTESLIKEAKLNLLQSLQVLLKAYLGKQKGFFAKIQRERSLSAAKESAQWHAKDLYRLEKIL